MPARVRFNADKNQLRQVNKVAERLLAELSGIDTDLAISATLKVLAFIIHAQNGSKEAKNCANRVASGIYGYMTNPEYLNDLGTIHFSKPN